MKFFRRKACPSCGYKSLGELRTQKCYLCPKEMCEACRAYWGETIVVCVDCFHRAIERELQTQAEERRAGVSA